MRVQKNRTSMRRNYNWIFEEMSDFYQTNLPVSLCDIIRSIEFVKLKKKNCRILRISFNEYKMQKTLNNSYSYTFTLTKYAITIDPQVQYCAVKEA